jgi:hypothetical protein
MKYILMIFICFLVLAGNSCKKEVVVNDEITYPATGQFGDNILSMQDSAQVVSGTYYGPIPYYSLCADLEEDAELKVIITNLTNNDTVTSSARYGTWFLTTENTRGMLFNSYDEQTHSQVFESSKIGLNDLEISFNASGSCRIDFYENNSTTVTLSKILFWSNDTE